MDRSVYTDHWELEETHWWFVGRRAVVDGLLRKILSSPRKIVDVGSGGGGMLPLLEKFGPVVSFEPDAPSAERLRQRFRGRFSITTGGVDAPTFFESRADVVTMFDVLEHIEDDVAALRQIFDALPHGGRFLCTVPAFPSLWSQHDVLSHHARRYTRRLLVQRLTEAGFVLERVTFFNTLLFLPTAGARWLFRFLGRPGSDFHAPRMGMNRLLGEVFSLEHLVLSFVDLPFGVSLFACAQKP